MKYCFIPTLNTGEHPLPVLLSLLIPISCGFYHLPINFPWVLRWEETAYLAMVTSHPAPHWLCSSPTFFLEALRFYVSYTF